MLTVLGLGAENTIFIDLRDRHIRSARLKDDDVASLELTLIHRVSFYLPEQTRSIPISSSDCARIAQVGAR